MKRYGKGKRVKHDNINPRHPANLGACRQLAGKNVRVISAIENSPADRTGVRAGDVMVNIDGPAAEAGAGAATNRQLSKRLRGAAGSVVTLALMRPGQGRRALDRGRAGAAKSATSRSPRPAPARPRRRHSATDSYPMPKTALAMLIALLHCGASGAPTSPFSIPQKMQGVWGNTPAACNGDVLADSSGYEIDAEVIRQLDENCRVVKVKRESATALTADFSCSWSDAPFPKTLALSLSADDSRLQVGDRRLVRCKSAK